MKGLVDAMTDEDPEKRPTIEDIISSFSHIRNSLSRIKLRTVILLPHSVDLWPKPLFEPADLTEYLLAALHLFFAVAGCSDIGELVDKRTCGVHELIEGW